MYIIMYYITCMGIILNRNFNYELMLVKMLIDILYYINNLFIMLI